MPLDVMTGEEEVSGEMPEGLEEDPLLKIMSGRGRFGIERLSGIFRRLITGLWKVPAYFARACIHQRSAWRFREGMDDASTGR